MTSLTSALQTTLTGMKIAQTQLGVVSNNLSNANDPDYTKKTLNTQSITLPGSGGVEITGYTRAIDDSISAAYNASISAASLTSTQSSYFDSIKSLYGVSTDTTALSSDMTDFSNAWQTYQSNPSSSANQTQVLATGQALAAEVKRLAGGVQQLDTQIKSQTTDSVAQVNSLLKDIQSLNGQITNATTSNGDPTSLLDKRDAKVRELSQYVDVKSIPAANNTIRLVSAQGLTLLDINPTPISYDGTNLTDASGNNISDGLQGGSLQALINLRADSSPATPSTDAGTEVIRKLQAQLGQVASNLLSTTGSPTSFAAAYNAATGTSSELAGGFFTGTDAYTIGVNSSLLTGAKSIKAAGADTVYSALNDNSRSYNVGGVVTQNVSYNGFINQIFSSLGQSSATISSANDLTTTARDGLKERSSGISGVNSDEELVNMTQIQNSYAVSAKVVSVINEMFDTLAGLIQ